MFRIQAPILIVPTVEAQQALGRHLRWAGLAAYREIAVAEKGLEIAHLQFAFFELTLAVCSRVRPDGIVEIEIGLGDPRLPVRSFTAAQIRQAINAARERAAPAHAARERMRRFASVRSRAGRGGNAPPPPQSSCRTKAA